ELISVKDDNRRSNQEVIKRYYNFGQNHMKCLEYHKKFHKKQVAKILANNEIRSQLPKEINLLEFFTQEELCRVFSNPFVKYLKPKLKNLPENAEQVSNDIAICANVGKNYCLIHVSAPLSLPEILQDEYTASIVLRAMKESPFPDDPALIIQWDDRGFNDVPTVPGCRNGVPGQTKAAIIAHLVANCAVDAYGLNLVFMFRNSDALSQCEHTIPAWHTDKEAMTHCKTNDSVTTNITSVTSEQMPQSGAPKELENTPNSDIYQPTSMKPK
ncbi:14707_t:CDS:2, partial [Cetraspora pellucida]